MNFQLLPTPEMYATWQEYVRALARALQETDLTVIDSSALPEGDGVSDYTTFLQALLDSGCDISLPAGVYLFTALTVTVEKTHLHGKGHCTILRQTVSDEHALFVQAGYFTLSDLRMEGSATDATNVEFAVFTDPLYPAPHLKVQNVQFTSNDSALGFNNGVKFDTGSDHGRVENCLFERLWGTASGHGYGILAGAAIGGIYERNMGIATANRGRHFIYISSGVTYTQVLRNTGIGWNYEAFTLNCLDTQPVSRFNKINYNIAIGASAIGGSANYSAISIFGNCQDNEVMGNIITDSGGCGIKIDGTGRVDGIYIPSGMANNHIVDNKIFNSEFIGIDIISMYGGTLSRNYIMESSLDAAGVHSNIRLVSDGTVGVSNMLIEDNTSTTALGISRSAFQLNTTAPVPTGLKVRGNKFDMCDLAAIELNGIACTIDGRIDFFVAVDPPEILAGTVWSGVFADGADFGIDNSYRFQWQATASNLDGIFINVYWNTASTLAITVFNANATDFDPEEILFACKAWERDPV